MRLGLILLLAACSVDIIPDGGFKPDGSTFVFPDSPSGGMPGTPVVSVMWTALTPCTVGQAGPVTFMLTVTDSDTPTEQLTITTTVPKCSPTSFTGTLATVTCPNDVPNGGNSVSAVDPQGHGAVVTFTMSPCQNGTAQ